MATVSLSHYTALLHTFGVQVIIPTTITFTLDPCVSFEVDKIRPLACAGGELCCSGQMVYFVRFVQVTALIGWMTGGWVMPHQAAPTALNGQIAQGWVMLLQAALTADWLDC